MKREDFYEVLGEINEERVLAARRSFHPWLILICILLTALFTFGMSWVVETIELDETRTETIYILPEDESHEALVGFLKELQTYHPLLFTAGCKIGVHMPGSGPVENTDILFHPPAAGVWAWNSLALDARGVSAGRMLEYYWEEGDPKEALTPTYGLQNVERPLKVGQSEYTVVGRGATAVALDAYLTEGLGADCVWLIYSHTLAPSVRARIYRLAREHFGSGSEYFRDRPLHDNLPMYAFLTLIVLIFCGVLTLIYSAILRRREGLDGEPGKYVSARADRVARWYAAWVFLGGLLGLIVSGLTLVNLSAANILFAWLCPAAVSSLLGWVLIRR